MFKKVVARAALGFSIGISIGYIITIIISLLYGEGEYYPCVDALKDAIGSESAAVVFQAFLCGILGIVFAAASVIWEIESWNLVKKSGVYFLITALTMMPIAYFTNWMPHTVGGFLTYFGIFLLIFVVVWLILYFVWKKKIRIINSKVGNP